MPDADVRTGRGLIWRHSETGRIAGPVKPARSESGRLLLGPIDRAMNGLILLIAVGAVAAAGWDAYRPVPHTPAMTAFVVSSLPVMVITGIAAAFVALAAMAGYHIASLPVRAIAGIAGVFLLWHYRAPEFLVLVALLASVFAVAGRYYRPASVNARMIAAGFDMGPLPRKDGTSFPGTPWQRPDEARERSLPNDQRQDRYREGRPPPGYTGRWGMWEYRNGDMIGGYTPKLAEHHLWDKDPKGQPIPTYMGDEFNPIEPPPSDDAPHGWQWLPGRGWVPYQDDPARSAAPRGFEPAPDVKAYGSNRPRRDDELRRDGAAYPWPGAKP